MRVLYVACGLLTVCGVEKGEDADLSLVGLPQSLVALHLLLELRLQLPLGRLATHHEVRPQS